MPGGNVFFHLDYLKLTVFADSETVLNVVEAGLMERAGLRLGGWIDKGPVQRWQHIFRGDGPVELLVPKDARITYTVVELKGEACAAAGAVAVHAFLSYLDALAIRWHGLRVDLAFNHVRFDPPAVHAAILAGDFNSRCFNLADRDWNENAEGRTA